MSESEKTLTQIIEETNEVYFLQAVISNLLETQKELVKLCASKSDVKEIDNER